MWSSCIPLKQEMRASWIRTAVVQVMASLSSLSHKVDVRDGDQLGFISRISVVGWTICFETAVQLKANIGPSFDRQLCNSAVATPWVTIMMWFYSIICIFLTNICCVWRETHTFLLWHCSLICSTCAKHLLRTPTDTLFKAYSMARWIRSVVWLHL